MNGRWNVPLALPLCLATVAACIAAGAAAAAHLFETITRENQP